MGDVISIPQRKRTAAVGLGDGATAQIVFFTGVRYQRMSEPTETSRPPQSEGGEGGKRKRKRG